MPDSFEDRLLTELQVAELAQIPVNTVRYFRQTKRLPSVKVGRHPRIWLSTFYQVFNKPDVNITPLLRARERGRNVSD